MDAKQGEPDFLNTVQRILSLVLISLVFVAASAGYFIYLQGTNRNVNTASLVFISPEPEAGNLWQPPDSTLIPKTPEGRLILYGKELIQHTARYLGPQGKVKKISNGLNCQSCHLNAG